MESSETGGGNLVLKARTSGTVRRNARDDIGSVVGFGIVGNRARIEDSSVFGVESLSDSRKTGEVFERAIWSLDWRDLDLFHVRDALGGPRANG